MTLPATRPAAALARRATRDALADWRLGCLADPAVLLVSELVTNVVQHAGPDVSATVLRLEYGDGWLRIEVHDTCPHAPRPRTPDWLDESGFGLMLVDALATKWGVQQTMQGKAVWAELDARPGGAASKPPPGRVARPTPPGPAAPASFARHDSARPAHPRAAHTIRYG